MGKSKYCSYCGKKLVLDRSFLYQSLRCPRSDSFLEYVTSWIHGRKHNWHDRNIDEEVIEPGSAGIYDVETGKKIV